jgi:hypothetical protein
MQNIKALLGILATITILALWVCIIITYPLTLTFVCIAALLTAMCLGFYRKTKN